MSDTIKQLLQNLVYLLVNSKFAEIEARQENGRLSAGDIKKTLEDYPGAISFPPDSAYDSAYIYDVYDQTTEARKIEFDLWYDNTVSDLTLSADVHKDATGKFKISIDDIHVL
jgi:hypothetical protein